MLLYSKLKFMTIRRLWIETPGRVDNRPVVAKNRLANLPASTKNINVPPHACVIAFFGTYTVIIARNAFTLIFPECLWVANHGIDQGFVAEISSFQLLNRQVLEISIDSGLLKHINKIYSNSP